MTTPTAPTGSAADELRAYYGCLELERRTHLRAVPAFDQHGQPTALVAIDPAAFCEWHDDLLSELYEGEQ